MPIQDTSVPIQQREPQDIKGPEFRAPNADTRVVDVSTLITHMDGTPTAVDYYHGVYTTDSESSSLQADRPAVYQSYTRIKKLEIYISSGFDFNFNADVKETTLEGSGTILPNLTPVEGDMFTMALYGGREGLFTITEVTLLSYITQRPHRVSFKMVSWLNSADYNDLVTKSIRTLVYVRDLYNGSGASILAEEDITDADEFAQLLESIPGIYYRKFYSTEFNTFLIPGEVDTSYDPYVTECLIRLSGVLHNDWALKCAVINCDTYSDTPIMTVWDALMEYSDDKLPYVSQFIELVSSNKFSSMAFRGNVRASGIKRVLMPKGVEYDDNSMRYHFSGSALVPASSISSTTQLLPSEDIPIHPRLLRSLTAKDVPTDKSIYIHPVTVDDSYVFSEAFYNDAEEGQSVLEAMVNQFLRLEPVSRNVLLDIAHQSAIWNDKEYFYYAPVLMILIHSALRGFGNVIP